MIQLPESTFDKRSHFRITLLVLCLLGLLTLGLLIEQELSSSKPYTHWQTSYGALLTQAGDQPLPAGIRQIESSFGGDRCPTCHLGIMDHDLKGRLTHPLKSHNPKTFKHHPPRSFGCTSCHGGSGRYVDRCLPALGQARNKQMIQASCSWCHGETENLAGAEKLTVGLRAYRRLGCGGCHLSDIEPRPRIGPPLDSVSLKLTERFLRAFLADPQALRPGTVMPSFFSDRQVQHAPSFTRRAMVQGRAKKIESLVSFLHNLSPTRWLPPQQHSGQPSLGQQLFNNLGCRACHRDTADLFKSSNISDEVYLRNSVDRRAGDPRLGAVGPNLSQAGQRLAPAWITRWLAAPQRLFPNALMPNFRLNPQEQGHLTAYLSSLGNPDGPTEIKGPPSPALMAKGRQLARELGCAGCHDLAPLTNVPPVGPDLDGFGDKSSAHLDWGSWSEGPAPKTPWTWTRLKLTQPLIFDRPPGVLIMPQQSYREGEQEGLQLLMASLTASFPPAGLLARPSAQTLSIGRGENIITRLNCRQCHEMGGRGGSIQALIQRPSERPPSLTGQGAKVLPSWIFTYLAQPTGLRPWLALRMPTFTLNDKEREHLAAYFAAQDKATYPFTPRQLAPLPLKRLEQALALFNRLQCLRCHQLSNASALKPGELSPDLALSLDRLRRPWIRRFILTPQQVMPGTKMPTLFILEDEDDPASLITPLPQFFGGDIPKQIEALVDLNLWWGSAAAATRLSTRP